MARPCASARIQAWDWPALRLASVTGVGGGAWIGKHFRDPVRAGNVGHRAFHAGEETTKTACRCMVVTAEKHHRPGEFATFAGFE